MSLSYLYDWSFTWRWGSSLGANGFLVRQPDSLSKQLDSLNRSPLKKKKEKKENALADEGEEEEDA